MATSKKTNSKSNRQPVKRRLSSSAKAKKTMISSPPLNKRAIELSIYLGKDRKIGFRAELSTPEKKKVKKVVSKSVPKNKNSVNKFQKTLTAMLITLGLAGTIFFGIQYQFAPSLNTPGIVIAEQVNNKRSIKSLSQSNARNLKIPSIGVDAPVQMVGQAEDSSIAVPANGETVGQYTLAPTPGERGPAIIVGHVDTLLGPAVFWRLHELTTGQEINVLRDDGATAKFKVYDIQQFPQDNFPNDKVYGDTDESELRLITCAGSFNFLKQRYDKNTVVFAKLI